MFLTRLKRETLSQHTAIERQIDLKRLLATTEAYKEHLARLYGFYLPLEETLWRTAAVRKMGLADTRRKTSLLHRDLRALKVEPNTLPLCTTLPPLGEDAQAMGCLYVLEGASLGGQVITRLVQERLGFTPDTGGAFFYGYGNETPVMWDGFRTVLEAFAQDNPARQETIIESACATFATLGTWLALDKGISNG